MILSQYLSPFSSQEVTRLITMSPSITLLTSTTGFKRRCVKGLKLFFKHPDFEDSDWKAQGGGRVFRGLSKETMKLP